MITPEIADLFEINQYQQDYSALFTGFTRIKLQKIIKKKSIDWINTFLHSCQYLLDYSDLTNLKYCQQKTVSANEITEKLSFRVLREDRTNTFARFSR